MLLNPAPGGNKTKRGWFRQYLILDTGSYVIGRDNTSLAAETSFDETDELNVLMESTSNNILTSITIDVDPFFIRVDDELSELLKKMYFKRASGDDLRVKYGEVYIEEGATGTITENVNLQDAVLLYNSFGGESTDAVASPFTLKLLIGTEQEASFNIATEEFTAVTTP